MRCPLGLILTNIFVIEFERSVIPDLTNKLNNLRRYVDDTICEIKVESKDHVLSKLNNFHKNIQLTVEVEKEGRISFLDVLMIRDKNNIETIVHRMFINNSICLNWAWHAPNKWKMGTLGTLVRRAYDICLANEHLENELCHIKKVCHVENQYPFRVFQVFCEIKRSNHQELQEQHKQQLPTNSSHEEVPNSKKLFLLLRDKGKRADNIIKPMKKRLYINYCHKLLTPRCRIQKENSTPVFKLKMKINYITSMTWCIIQSALVSCVTKIRRSAEIVKDHNGRDQKRKPKTIESLLNKQLRPKLNIHNKSVPLKKIPKKNTSAVLIRTIVTFASQIFLLLI